MYLSSLPNLRFRVLTRSSEHWSVFCNGHYYHLRSLSRSADAPFHPSHIAKNDDRPSTQFEDMDTSNPDLPSYSFLPDMSGRPLLAYHMGQTSYSPCEIRQIAQWIIGLLDQYGFLASNCEHFVLCLLMRIVNRGRVRRLFLGTAIQIANWDRKPITGSTSHQSKGFSGGLELIRPSDPVVMTFLQWHYLNWKIDAVTRHPQTLRTQGLQAPIANNSFSHNVRSDLCCNHSTDVCTPRRNRIIDPGGGLASNVERNTKHWRSSVESVKGFSFDDIIWARHEDASQALADYLAPSEHNQARRYHIGVAYLQPKGHAAIILQDGSSGKATPFEIIYRQYENEKLPAAGVRLLHIRFLAGRSDTFTLVLSEPQTRNLRFIRYHDLYRIYTTERVIRHAALRACPQSHQYITSDCATYVFNFLNELLGYLGKQCVKSNMEPHVNYLALHNHVYDGALGALESDIRRKAQKAAMSGSIPSGTIGAIGAVAPVFIAFAGVGEPWRIAR
ncbi:hypothetical protein PG994_008066 [Apiospora phragmitis]|uniref:Uncharacterized protein n=1 Tax=Apiospora phragmitis TaxID=2905665 RepID=A0ABR1UUH4_9PEZI